MSSEHILVCLSSSPANTLVIKAAARLAEKIDCQFTAVFVETPSFEKMSGANKEKLHENTRLASELGAKIENVYGQDIAFQISEFAKKVGVTKIFIGKNSVRPKLRQAIAERISSLVSDADIYIIPNRLTSHYEPPSGRDAIFSLKSFLKTLLILIFSTAICFLFRKLEFQEINMFTVFVLGILVTAVVTASEFYSVVSSICGVLLFNFLFAEPRFSFDAYNFQYPITFITLLIAALISGGLAGKMNRQAKQSAQVAYRTNILLETDQLLRQAKNFNEIKQITANQLIKLVEKDIVFYEAGKNTLSEPVDFKASENVKEDIYNNQIEKDAALWVLKNQKSAGATTDKYAYAKYLYLPIRTAESTYGVVGIALFNKPLSTFENNLVLSILGECALALEKELYNQKREEAAIQAKNEQLRSNLLRSISHDLRTPLTSISGNAGLLINSSGQFSESKKQQLYNVIKDDSIWLLNSVENLLSVTRLENGKMNIKIQPEMIDEIIFEAVTHIKRQNSKHIIRIERSDDMLMAKMDARLIVQVIINIIDNAIKYTKDGSEIVISYGSKNNMVSVNISDNGDGIPDDAKEKIFDMFYTSSSNISDSRRGLGLGLALCKAIIIAHAGSITVRDNIPHGSVFTFTLPEERIENYD